MGHLLALAVCYECFSRRYTWDNLADEFAFDHVGRWRKLWKDFGGERQQGL